MNRNEPSQLKRSTPVVVVLVLAVAVLFSALAVVHFAHLNRNAWNQLQTERTEKQQLQVEWGQLLLQHSTLTDPAQIERLATQKLDMEVPAIGKMVVVGK